MQPNIACFNLDNLRLGPSFLLNLGISTCNRKLHDSLRVLAGLQRDYKVINDAF